MTMRQIFSNFSWDTLMALPPTEFLALMALAAISIALAVVLYVIFFAVVAYLDR